MTKEEKINKILEMTKELAELQMNDITDKEVDDLYIQTKFTLQAFRELRGIQKEGENNGKEN